MSIDLTYFRRCISTLEQAQEKINSSGKDDLMYEIIYSACIKEFEVILEQSAKLLRKCLANFSASNKAADRLHFKDVFRTAAKRDLIDIKAVERWFAYREKLNDTTHENGEHLAEENLKLLPQFILDAKALADTIEKHVNV